jgi:hypothetical protein
MLKDRYLKMAMIAVGASLAYQQRKEQLMSKRIITAEVDEQWFEILGQITRHQDGFVWIEVKDE